ncbi:4Fe-4S binding protein [Clostridium sardiniense]|uniref:4Fe-4S binding protein n=1 Tax=Clostridium sardiniense TaxID=29369 RepID=A0ABS7L186_CLOSR|nr:4Fe-4S binding protein [Clostridium sardiniense]MBY0756824.1 4Fe-4S binding protein [Clostridium sardiniense]MDQ0458666.1 Fe-S-cluster-containing hydrogenase component 2 [Clostridium sardiniense]
MQILNENNKRTKLVLLKYWVDKIECQPQKKTVLDTEQGKIISGCLRCDNPKCMYFYEERIKCSRLDEFPGERENKVCPVDALLWDNQNEIPIINQKKCIKCGICASECPIGAIYFKDNQFLINNVANSHEYIEVPFNSEGVNAQREIISALEKLKKYGKLIDENDAIMQIVYNNTIVSKLVPEKLIRNILVSLGCECSTRRIGDVYTRMDAIYKTTSGTFGAVEVEFGTDTLDASRAILDDIAVLESRYGIDKSENIALVVCLSLPNLRQGYWQVIKDIKNVVNLRVNTQTLGAMLILLWNFSEIDLNTNDYYSDYDTPTIRKYLERDLGRKVRISDKFLGILEPIK